MCFGVWYPSALWCQNLEKGHARLHVEAPGHGSDGALGDGEQADLWWVVALPLSRQGGGGPQTSERFCCLTVQTGPQVLWEVLAGEKTGKKDGKRLGQGHSSVLRCDGRVDTLRSEGHDPPPVWGCGCLPDRPLHPLVASWLSVSS